MRKKNVFAPISFMLEVVGYNGKTSSPYTAYNPDLLPVLTICLQT